MNDTIDKQIEELISIYWEWREDSHRFGDQRNLAKSILDWHNKKVLSQREEAVREALANMQLLMEEDMKQHLSKQSEEKE